MDQPGKVANPARGQLNPGKMNISLSALLAPENLWSRETGSAVPSRVSACSSPCSFMLNLVFTYYVREESRVPRRRPFICLKPPYAIGSVPNLSVHQNRQKHKENLDRVIIMSYRVSDRVRVYFL